MILMPKSFGTLTFGASSGVYAASMDISAPKAVLKIRQVAGGRLVNFDYGYRATVMPTPFTVELLIKGSSQSDLNDTYQALVNSQLGIIGTYKQFIATDLESVDWVCTAGCESIDKVLTVDDVVQSPQNILFEVQAVFVPDSLWSVYT